MLGVFTLIMGFPERLKEQRAKLRLSQREVANILEVSPSVISAYESGERTPSVEILLRLSDLYQCSTDYLLGRTDEKPATLVDVSELTDSQTQAVMAVVNAFKNTSCN